MSKHPFTATRYWDGVAKKLDAEKDAAAKAAMDLARKKEEEEMIKARLEAEEATMKKYMEKGGAHDQAQSAAQVEEDQYRGWTLYKTTKSKDISLDAYKTFVTGGSADGNAWATEAATRVPLFACEASLRKIVRFALDEAKETIPTDGWEWVPKEGNHYAYVDVKVNHKEKLSAIKEVLDKYAGPHKDMRGLFSATAKKTITASGDKSYRVKVSCGD